MDYDALQRRRDAAARKIQAAWLAYKGRRAFLRMRDAANRIQAVAKGWYVRKKVQEQRGRQEMEQRFQALMDRHREKMRILEVEKRELLKLPGADVEEWERRRFLAAIKVQAAWRGLVARRKMAQSPERAKREQAARRIQAAFKKVHRSRSGVAALSGVASAAASVAFAPGSGLSPSRQSYQLRQSGASVLLGSPQLRESPGGGFAGGSPVGGGRVGSPLGGRSPERSTAGTGGAADLTRGSSTMGARRYKELQTQVEGKLGAYVALGKARGIARRADSRATDARLAALLADHHRTAPERLAAAHTRQRNLVQVDTLCAQLEQVRPLADLPPDAAPQDFPRPARGSVRAERAAQAHALALAEARVGSHWWTHLRGLNTQAVQDAIMAEDEERWEALDSAWRRRWKEAEDQENRRPEVLEDMKPATGVGAAAVAAARQMAALQAKEAEYIARAAAAAVAVPTSPMAGS